MAKYKLGRDVDLDKEVVKGRSGKRITEAGAEKLAEETLRKVGRPSLSGQPEASPRVSFRTTAKVARQVDQIAAKRGVSRSVIAREALEQYVAK